MNMLLAQLGAGYSVTQWVIILIVIISVIGILYVVVRQSGVQIPGWVIQIFWIVALAIVAIFAVKLLMSMM
jgi:hypothetical protein